MKATQHINEKVLSFLDDNNIDLMERTVVVGVSGGADSMCLLNVFNEISRQKGFNIISAHVNHCIRGIEADEDEEFVREFCEKRNITFFSKRVDILALSKQRNEGEEETGRRERYEFFNSLGGDVVIATAHNLDDRLETFLLNFTRGSSLKGLVSIPPVRGNIIRPLINVTRSQIEEYDRENDIFYRTDSTNLTDEYTRNKIRHSVIPTLKSINPSLLSTFLSCEGSISADNDCLDLQTKKIYNDCYNERFDCFDTEKITNEHKSIRSRVIYKIFEHFGAVNIESKHISDFVDNLGNEFSVNLHSNVTVATDGTWIYKSCEPYSDVLTITEDENVYDFDGCEIDLSDFVDRQNLNGLVIRHKRAGDTFRQRNTHKKQLKKLFCERKIPPFMRNSIILLADNDDIVFAEGIGMNEKFSPREISNVKITVKREK